MTIQGRPVRTQWIHDEIKPDPADVRLERARQLPCPKPGLVVPVPLDILMEYFAIHGLLPDGIREPRVKLKYGPGEAILLTKRITQEAEHE